MSDYDKHDIQTAAYRSKLRIDPVGESYEETLMDFWVYDETSFTAIKEKSHFDEVVKQEKLITHKDHKQAVEQAKKEERREILDKIEKRIRKLKQDKQSAKAEAHAKGNALAHDVNLELRGSITELEELRDEVRSE